MPCFNNGKWVLIRIKNTEKGLIEQHFDPLGNDTEPAVLIRQYLKLKLKLEMEKPIENGAPVGKIETGDSGVILLSIILGGLGLSIRWTDATVGRLEIASFLDKYIQQGDVEKCLSLFPFQQ